MFIQPGLCTWRSGEATQEDMIRGDTLVTMSLSLEKVLVTAKPQPARKARAIMSLEVVGGAEARPKGFGNLTPATVTERSTSSMMVWNLGRRGTESVGMERRKQ